MKKLLVAGYWLLVENAKAHRTNNQQPVTGRETPFSVTPP
jgi:hypothetical protein